MPNGLVVGCESLFVPLRGGHVAGFLFGATGAGMMVGDLTIGRFTTARTRDRLIEPLRLLLAVPYLSFALRPPAGVAVALAFTASLGYAAALPLQDRLIRHTDKAAQGQVLGLHGQGMMVMQAIGALIAGLVAGHLPIHLTMGLMAAASIIVTISLTPGLRRSADPEA